MTAINTNTQVSLNISKIDAIPVRSHENETIYASPIVRKG